MVLATRIREAYEYAFRGNKREYMGVLQQIISNAPAFHRRTGRVESIICDKCGVECCDKDNTSPFYFCRRCKKEGIRHELCVSCHAIEVLQGEGKYVGKEFHPHFALCSHANLEKHTKLGDAYPGAEHLTRASCDYCGHMVFVAGGCSIHVCRECPTERGYRFELCEPCSVTLRDRGYDAIRAKQDEEHESRPNSP
jgi:hypothetical protein